MGGDLRAEWIHVYVWLSGSAVHLKLSQHCESAILQYNMASLVAQTVKKSPAMRETWVRFLGWEDPLEEGMAC